MDIKLILIFAALIAAIGIYVVVREKINLRRAATGEDKERLRRAVAQALPGESGYQVAYGHYENVQHYGPQEDHHLLSLSLPLTPAGSGSCRCNLIKIGSFPENLS